MQGTVCTDESTRPSQEAMGATAGRNLEATITVNRGNATAGAGGCPKSPMAQAAIMGCLSPGRRSRVGTLGKKAKQCPSSWRQPRMKGRIHAQETSY